jgi:hypothetical protein
MANFGAIQIIGWDNEGCHMRPDGTYVLSIILSAMAPEDWMRFFDQLGFLRVHERAPGYPQARVIGNRIQFETKDPNEVQGIVNDIKADVEQANQVIRERRAEVERASQPLRDFLNTIKL